MLRNSIFAALLLVQAPACLAATLEEDAKAFGTRETVQSMDIAPSGKLLLAVVSGAGRTSVVKIMDATTMEAHPIIMSYERGEEWGWCYVDQGYFESLPAVMEQIGKPAPPTR